MHLSSKFPLQVKRYNTTYVHKPKPCNTKFHNLEESRLSYHQKIHNLPREQAPVTKVFKKLFDQSNVRLMLNPNPKMKRKKISSAEPHYHKLCALRHLLRHATQLFARWFTKCLKQLRGGRRKKGQIAMISSGRAVFGLE